MPDFASAARAIAERRPLLGRIDDHARLHRPSPRSPPATLVLQMRNRRHDHLECADAILEQRDRLARRPPVIRRISPGRLPGRTSSTGGSARRRAASSALGRSSFNLLDQRMSDIAAGRPAEPLVHLRLERQQREHVIDIGAHGARPARPPRPDRRRDVVDDRDRRRAPAHAPCDPVGQVRAVDDDEHIRPRRHDRRRRSRGYSGRCAGRCVIDAKADDREIAGSAPAAAVPRRACRAPPMPTKRTGRGAWPAARASAPRRGGRRTPRPR